MRGRPADRLPPPSLPGDLPPRPALCASSLPPPCAAAVARGLPSRAAHRTKGCSAVVWRHPTTTSVAGTVGWPLVVATAWRGRAGGEH